MSIKFGDKNPVEKNQDYKNPGKKAFSGRCPGCNCLALFVITLWGLGTAAGISGNYCLANEVAVVSESARESLNKASEPDSGFDVSQGAPATGAAADAATLESWQTLLANPPKYIEANFVTTRYIHQGGRVFRSTGRTEISNTYGICWHMLTPKEKTFHVGGEQDEASLPGLDFLTALVNGDTKSLDATFEASYQGTPLDGTVFFRPRGGDLARIIFSVNAVFKNKLLASVIAVNKDGGSTRVEFTDYVLTPSLDLSMENFCREQH